MKNKRIFLFTLVALSIGVNIYFRLSTLFLWPLDKVAKNAAYASISAEINQEIDATYPGLAEADKEGLSEGLFRQRLREREAEVKESILAKSRELKSYYQDENGWTYMMEVDPYRWYRRIDNFLERGHFGTILINNQDYDSLMLFPSGAKIEPLKLHFYIGAYFHKLLHFINSSLPLSVSLSFLPVFLSAFMVVGIFCVSSMLGVSSGGSLAASLAVGLSPLILMRSVFGWFDTDIYNVFLPLFILCLAAYSFKENGRRRAIFLFLSALLIGVYSSIWSIWWLTFYILAAGLFLYKFCVVSKEPGSNLMAKVKDSFLELSLFVLSVYLAVSVISGPEAVMKSFSDPVSLLATRFNLKIDNFWPGMADYIQELSSADISYIEAGVGGSFIFYAGVFGILFLIIKKRALLDFSEKGFLLFVLSVWMAVTLALTYFSRRFIIFLAVPLGIFFGAFLDMARDFMLRQKNKIIILRDFDAKACAVLLSGIFIAGSALPVHSALGHKFFPNLNDAKWNMMAKIRNSTPADAVINASWNQGDFIMTIAGRATLHCPQYNLTPVAYWIARFFLTDNEKEALGILKMLNAGGNQAFQELSRLLGGDNLAALELINIMILTNKEEAKALLGRHTADNLVIDRILGLVYEPRHPAYLLVEQRLTDILSYLNTLANWDFRKQELWRSSRGMNKAEFIDYATKKYGYSGEYSERLYKEIGLTSRARPSGWISKERYQFYSPYLEEKIADKNAKIILFPNGLMVDRDNLNAFYWQGQLGKWIIPSEVISISAGRVKEKKVKGDDKYSLLFLEEGDAWGAVLADRHLARSMLVKLYFMKGTGLKHFKLCEQEEGKARKSRAYLYKIVWGEN